MTVELRPGDNRDSLRRMIARGEFVHSVVCDPPYGLTSVVKRFGGTNAAPAKHGTDGLFARQSRGFMGKLWDGSGIERDPEFWRLVYDVMLPGAYIVAFSSSRTYGYMQVAMEAAGFITHPMIGWCFNTGMPKGHDAGKAIDRTLGAEGTIEIDQKKAKQQTRAVGTNAYGDYAGSAGEVYTPGSEEGRKWDGYKHGTQALKPALEPIYIGQKPYSEKTGALNILKHGVGAINVDGCRVAVGDDSSYTANCSGDRGHADNRSRDMDFAMGCGKASDLGRYPANLIHDGSPEVVALFPEKSGGAAPPSQTGSRTTERVYGEYAQRSDVFYEEPLGSAARFFNSFPLLCYPKAGKADRAGSKHATVKPIKLMQHLVRMHTPPGGVVLDPFAGSGTTGQACLNEGMRCILMEAEAEYIGDIERRFDLPRNPLYGLLNALTEATK